MEAKKISETISKEGSQLLDNGEIDGDDFHKILLAVANIFEYLNTKYGDDEKLNEEVRNMTKTLYDPAVEQRGIEIGIEKGIEKTAINMLKKGKPIEDIIDATELPYERILELKSKYKS